MTPPATIPRRSFLRLLALSLTLGVTLTFALCLLFAYRSSAYQAATWQVVAPRADDLAWVVRQDSLGKTIISWAPLRGAERVQFERNGTYGAANIAAGPQRPPAWSAFWDDAEFRSAVEARSRFGHYRHDIAVGWPFRALTCTRFTDESADPQVQKTRGGRQLPMMLADRGEGFMVGEIRAVPLRPIWRGLLANTLVFALACLMLLGMRSRLAPRRAARSVWSPAPRALRPDPASILRLAPVVLLLGLVTTAATAVALPLLLRQRSISAGCVERPYSYKTIDLFWTQLSTRLPSEEILTMNADAATDLDRALRSLEYSTDPNRRMRGERDKIDGGPPNPYTSTRTGWPLPCLWGATWSVGTIPPQRSHANLGKVPKLHGIVGVFNRGIKWMPTRPLCTGWIVNTLVFAAGWLAVFVALGSRRRARRLRSGRCPRCAYDLVDTPANGPCPECGHVTRARHAPSVPVA